MLNDDILIHYPLLTEGDISDETALKILAEMSLLMARLYNADVREYGEEEAGELLYNSCMPLIVLCGFDFIQSLVSKMEIILEYSISQEIKDQIYSAFERGEVSAEDILRGLYDEEKYD